MSGSKKIIDITSLERFSDNIKTYIDNTVTEKVSTKQDQLISGTNIKTLNNQPIMGEGNINIIEGNPDANIGAVDTNDILDDVETNKYIKYVQQSLTDEEKRQARKNIAAISIDELPEYEQVQDMVMTSISYDELKILKEASQLIPGATYRITDYVCTTTESNTKAMSNRFDIIVIADSENVLNETAHATYHEGDTYFSHCKLEAWELKYCFDNDTDRFAWADAENGKGVIYYMKDDRNNECPYDFKNILFYTDNYTVDTTSDNYYYTFSYVVDNVLYDGATEEQVKYCYSNIIKARFESNKRQLNNIIFRSNNFSLNCFSNTFGDSCFSNTFGDSCFSNTFGNNCYSNTFGGYCYLNIFGDGCHSNNFGYNYYSNTFGNNCIYLDLGTNINIGTGLHLTSFEDNCTCITITKSKNTVGLTYPSCRGLKFGINCKYLTLCSNNSSDTEFLQNYTINNFVAGTSSDDRLIINLPGKTALSRTYETKIGLNSSGEVVQYCEADFVLPQEVNNMEVEVGNNYIKLNSDDIITTDNSLIINSENITFGTNTPNNENYKLIIEL